MAFRHAARQTNLQLQGRKLLIAEMYDNIESFKVKLTLWRKQLIAGNLLCFSKLESLEKVKSASLRVYTDITSISGLLRQFELRFKDFRAIESRYLFSTHFSVYAECITEQLQMELVELYCDIMLEQKYKDICIPDFYRFLLIERFPCPHSTAMMMAMLISTYMCKQFCCFIKHTKVSLHTKLTEEHLQATLSGRISGYYTKYRCTG